MCRGWTPPTSFDADCFWMRLQLHGATLGETHARSLLSRSVACAHTGVSRNSPGAHRSPGTRIRIRPVGLRYSRTHRRHWDDLVCHLCARTERSRPCAHHSERRGRGNLQPPPYRSIRGAGHRFGSLGSSQEPFEGNEQHWTTWLVANPPLVGFLLLMGPRYGVVRRSLRRRVAHAED